MSKKHISLWLEPDILKECEINMQLEGCKTRSEYLERAIAFYNGFLHEQNNEEYVSRVILSTVEGILKGTEDRMARLMFKQAVELAKIFKIISLAFETSDETLDELHFECVKEVKKLNGALRPPSKKGD